MKQNFSERKNDYISYVLGEYSNQEEKGIGKVFPSLGYEFITTNKYEIIFKKKDNLKKELVIKPTLGKYVIWIILITFILISTMKLADVWYINILVFSSVVTILTILSYIKIGKPIIKINSNSIFIKEYGNIEWINIIMTYFKVYYDDGEYKVASLIIHYFDEPSDCFKSSEITFQGLSTSPEEIAFYISRFSK